MALDQMIPKNRAVSAHLAQVGSRPQPSDIQSTTIASSNGDGTPELERVFPGDSELAKLMRSKDWSKTPLGPPDHWPQSLRTSVSTCLNCSFPILVWWGPELVKLYNDAYTSILGAKHPSALGAKGQDVWPEIWDVIGPMLDRVMSKGEATPADDLLLILERYGYREEGYFSFSYSPIRDESGEVGGIFCPVIETTHRVIGERRLRLQRRLAEQTGDLRSADAVCSATVACFTEDSRRDFPFVAIYRPKDEEAAVRLVATAGIAGCEAAFPETFGLAVAETAPWPVADTARTAKTVVVKTEETTIGRLPCGPWGHGPRHAFVLPLGGSSPAAFMVVGVNPFRPFEEMRELAELIAGQVSTAIGNALASEAERRRAEALAEIDRAKTAFFSNVSHEFRTPLTLLLGPLEDVLARPEENLSPDDRGLVRVAHRNGVRLLKLVNTLLDFTRIEAGRAQAHYKPTDIATFTADLAANFRSATDRAGLALKIDCPSFCEPVHVDRDMWEKIVLNLVSNAFKFTFEGEIVVELFPSVDGRAVELTVRDTGVGVPPHELPRLFERFHRVESQRSRSFEGSGIGLALVQELVKLHGGSIRVDSEVGRGSAFIVAIPRGTAHLPAEHVETDSAAASDILHARAFVVEALRWLPDVADIDAPVRLEGASSDFPESIQGIATGKRSRILLADDNADMRDYVQRLLGARFEVQAVADGEAALAVARLSPPDLFLLDVMMPRLDGFGLLRAIRADSRLRELPVILLSARAGEDAKIEGLDAGADDYLVKPFSARELIARVQANLQMAKIRKDGEDALRKRTTELETVLETIPAAVWFTHDPDAQHVFGNRQAANLLRVPIDVNASLSAPPFDRPSYRVFRNSEEAPASTLPIQRAARGEIVPEEELEIRLDDGSIATILTSAAPLRDATGQIHGAVSAAVDITERKRMEEALRASEALQTFMLSFGDRVNDLGDSRAIMAAATEALGRCFGVSRVGYGEVEPDGANIRFETDWTDGTADHLIGVFPLANFGAGNMAELARGLTTTYADLEADPRTAGAGFAAIQARAAMAVPLVRDGRLIAALYLNHRDVRPWAGHEVALVEEVANRTWAAVERARAEAALRENEVRFRAIADNIPQLAWMADREGNVDWFNRGWLEYTGTTLQDNVGEGWKAVHHPDHVDVVAEKFERHLREGRDWEDTFPLRAKDGSYRWFLSRMNVIRDESGKVMRFFGTNTDITERLKAEEQRKLLINELNHRVKNTLATVQSLAMQTMRNTERSADARELFEARLAALSRAHDMLTAESWESARLRDAVNRALEPFRSAERRLMVEGPDVRLSPKQALALSMALHELATNATKYGALSNDAGRVRIAWSIAPLDGLGELQLTWIEEGGPPVIPPKRRGFGSRLIERSLAHDLGGDASIEYRPEGVIAVIRSPLEPAGGGVI